MSALSAERQEWPRFKTPDPEREGMRQKPGKILSGLQEGRVSGAEGTVSTKGGQQ